MNIYRELGVVAEYSFAIYFLVADRKENGSFSRSLNTYRWQVQAPPVLAATSRFLCVREKILASGTHPPLLLQ